MSVIKIGHITKKSWKPEVLAAIDNHIAEIDLLLVKELTEQGGYFSTEYQSLLFKRGCSYAEYLELFKPVKSIQDYGQKPIFQLLNITSEVKRNALSANMGDTIQDYLEFLDTHTQLKSIISPFELSSEIPFEKMYQHCYMNGATGSGKSTIMKTMIDQLASLEQTSLVIIDAQGLLADSLIALKSIDKDRIVYFKPKLSDTHTPIINVLDLEDKDQANSLALRLSRVIAMLSEDNLSAPMLSLLRTCLLTLLSSTNKTYSLKDLSRFMIKGQNLDLLHLASQLKGDDHKLTLARFDKAYFSSSKDAVISKLDKLLFDNSFKLCTTGKSILSIEQAIQQSKVVIVDLSGMVLESVQALGKLIISIVVHFIMKRQTRQLRQANRVFLFVDEFQNFLTEDIIRTLDEARQKKLHLIAAHTRIGQFNTASNSGSSLKYMDSVLGNTAVKFFGTNDSPDTITTLSSLLGIQKESLIKMPNYEFILRIKGQADLSIKSSNQINDPELYRTDAEMEALLQETIDKYYTPISKDINQIDSSQDNLTEDSTFPIQESFVVKEPVFGQQIKIIIDESEF